MRKQCCDCNCGEGRECPSRDTGGDAYLKYWLLKVWYPVAWLLVAVALVWWWQK